MSKENKKSDWEDLRADILDGVTDESHGMSEEEIAEAESSAKASKAEDKEEKGFKFKKTKHAKKNDALATVGTEHMSNQSQELKTTPVTKKLPKTLGLIVGGLAVHSFHKSHRNKIIMEQQRRLKKAYEDLPKPSKPEWTNFYEKAKLDVQQEILDKKVSKIRKTQEFWRKAGSIISAATFPIANAARLSMQKRVYDSVRADTSGAKKRDVPTIIAGDMLDPEYAPGMMG